MEGITAKGTFTAIKTVLAVAEDIGDEALSSVKGSINKSIDGAKDIIHVIESKKKHKKTKKIQIKKKVWTA